MIAICHHIAENGGWTILATTPFMDTKAQFLPLLLHSLDLLVEKKMLTKITDDFGPTIYKRTSAFIDAWESVQKIPNSPYSKYALAPDKDAWINSAVESLDKALVEQRIKEVDFEKPDTEWAPLPVERSNPKLQEATRKLDETIAAIDADNGYNATLPEEKAYVVENLRDAVAKLKKEDTISYGYLKRKVINILDVVIRRFGKAAVGLTAQAARAAIFDWLKEIGAKVLHWLY